MKTYRIATVPGDGIGKEVVPAGQELLETLAAAATSVSSSRTSTGGAITTAAMA